MKSNIPKIPIKKEYLRTIEDLVTCAGVVRSICSHNSDYPRSRKPNGKEFDFVPSSSSFLKTILTTINNTRKTKDYSVLDAGCGVSPLLVYLKKYYPYNGITLCGIDNEQDLLRILRSLLIPFSGEIINDDLMNLSNTTGKELVAKADFVYSYMPVRDPDDYCKMIRGIWRYMKKGAIFMSLYGPAYLAFDEKSDSIRHRNEFNQLEPYWIKN